MALTIQNRHALLGASAQPVFVERQTESSSELVEDLTIAQATDLLDWLEGHNIHASDVRLEDSGRMSVAWIS